MLSSAIVKEFSWWFDDPRLPARRLAPEDAAPVAGREVTPDS
jgi:hypothetical protein